MTRELTAVVALGLLGFTSAAVVCGVSSVGMAFPGLVVDPNGRFSAVFLPSWGAEGLGLQYPDRAIEVGGVRLPEHPDRGLPTSRAFYSAVREVADRSGEQVEVVFDTGSGPVRVMRPVLRLSTDAVAFFFGVYALAGLLALSSALVVLAVGRGQPVTWAYAFWAVSAHLMYSAFFDFHTTTRLGPAFSVGVVGFAFGQCWLAYSFPSPPQRARKVARLGLAGAAGLAVWASSYLAFAPWLSIDATRVQGLAGLGLPLGSLTLLTATLVRWRHASGAQRDELRSALVGLAAAPVLVGVGFLASEIVHNVVYHLVLPFLLLVTPLAVGYAVIRHDLFASTALLTHRLLHGPILVVALITAVLLWLAARIGGPPKLGGADLSAGMAGMGFVAAVFFGQRLADRWLFPAMARFRPTIEQLADQFARLDGAKDLRAAIEENTRRWLPAAGVEVRDAVALRELPALSGKILGYLEAGEVGWCGAPTRQLLIPMRSRGTLRGALVVTPKDGAAILTSEDVALCRTIASLGAVALHNVDVLHQLETTRQLELEVTREDKRATLALLGAELAHEIAHPLQYFRGLLRRAERDALDERDIAVGSDEIERLERLLSSMRRLEVTIRREPVELAQPIERALAIVRPHLDERHLEVQIDLALDLTVRASADGLIQVFANLLRNAAHASRENGKVGIRARVIESTVRIEVWDEGEGVPQELAGRLFHRWVSGSACGTGLGLAVARNIVMNLDGTIGYHREDGRTVFEITLPAAGGNGP